MSSGVTESLVGHVLDGRYRVLSHIADGGMATVYLALDTRLEREVALKVMRPGLASDETFVSRFRREARSAARLSHPHVVAVFDQGEDDGSMFLAMEYVPGQTLREVMQAEGPLTPAPPSTSWSPFWRPWRPRTGPGSSTGTSSRRTSSSARTAPSRSPTSVSPGP